MNKHIVEEWEGVEWLIERNLKAIESEIQKFYQRLIVFNCKRSDAEIYVAERLPELIKKVTEG